LELWKSGSYTAKHFAVAEIIDTGSLAEFGGGSKPIGDAFGVSVTPSRSAFSQEVRIEMRKVRKIAKKYFISLF
jgi:hypothetical protein